jgi:putative membrane protein
VKFVYWFVALAVAIVLIVFAVSNLDPVVVSFWPVASLETRLCVIVLLALLVGFLVGEMVAWINGRGWRREARKRARRIEALERELAATRVPSPAPELAHPPVLAAPRD